MARLNIESSIFTDQRFFNLGLKLQSMDRALGSLVRAWMLAQKWYTKGDKMIPKEEWDKQNLPAELIECGLAELVGQSVRMRGANDQFSWLDQKIEAGRKGGIASRRPKKNDIPTERRLASAKQRLACGNPLTLSLSLNTKKEESIERSSIADVNSRELSKKTKSVGEYTGEQKAWLIGKMVNAFAKRFDGARPTLGAKELGILRRLSKEYRPEALLNLYETFLQMRDNWFEKKAWDLATFEQNIQKVSVSLQTGKERTSASSVLADARKLIEENEELDE